MDNDTQTHAPAINQANTDGRIYWDQVNGSIKITVQDVSGELNTLVMGVEDSGNLGVQIVNDSGVVLFDAFQTTSTVVSDSNVSGDFTDIQRAIDVTAALGGGIVFIRNGTYLLSDDIIMPSNVTLRGETAGGVILDFQDLSKQILIKGANVYIDGTITTTNFSTTVTGVSTNWDSLMIGRSISVNNFYYTIIDVVSPTEITLEVPYEGLDYSGSYAIASILTDIRVENLTIQNSHHLDGAVFVKYSALTFIEDIVVYNSTIGINYEDCSQSSGIGFFIIACDIGLNVQNCATWTFNGFEVYGSTNDNVLIDNLINASVSNFTLSTAGGNALTINNSFNWGLYDFAILSSGNNGIELIDCLDISIFAAEINSSANDGFLLSSGNSNIGFTSVQARGNGGYGLNISDISNDSISVIASSFIDNLEPIQNNGINTVLSAISPRSVRKGTIVSAAIPDININLVDYFSITAQAEDITVVNLLGTATENQTLWVSITGTATWNVTWGGSFEASTVALPTTISTTRTDVGFVWNSVAGLWRCVATA